MTHRKIRSSKTSFLWIAKTLKDSRVPFRISGGFAANLYGSNRELADIDIEISKDHIYLVAEKTKRFIIYGPKRYKDRNWDLLLLTLKYYNQVIDICAFETIKIYDKNRGIWIKMPNALADSNIMKAFGINASVIRLSKLIDYKSRLKRRVDVKDVKSLQS